MAHTFGRARKHALTINDETLLARALIGIQYFYFTRAEFHTAAELEKQIVQIGERTKDASVEIVGRVWLGATSYHQGHPIDAVDQFDRALSLYDYSKSRTQALTYGQDPCATAHGYAALALWKLGKPEQALERSRASIELARTANHPFTLAWAFTMNVWLHQMRREIDQVLQRAGEAVALAERHAFPFFIGAGKVLRGWALAHSANGKAGIAEYREGFELCAAPGAQFTASASLGMGAEAYAAAGQVEGALRALQLAFRQVEKNGERFWEAELHRLKGELLLMQQGDNETVLEAKESLRRAIEIARSQDAKSLELRAATSIARLLRNEGKCDAARYLLAPLYAYFTEGFDTPDLMDAKALLADME